MPHDANGSLLKVGDRVLIEAEIEELSQNETKCNARFKITSGPLEEIYRPVFTCNSRLSLLVGRGPGDKYHATTGYRAAQPSEVPAA